MKKLVLLALFFASINSYAATKTNASVGLITSYSPAVYRDTGSNVVPFPLLGYEGEHLFLRGTSAGYRLQPYGSPTNLIFRVIYDARTFKPEDSDDAQMKLLDERESSFLVGVSYQVNSVAGIFEVGAGTDIGSTHNGLYAEVTYRLPINRGAIGFIPEIGYSYNSDKLNNHLYGVSNSEAQRSEFESFDLNWSGQYFIGLSSYLHLTRNLRITGSVRYTNLDSDVAQSPILESSVSTVATIGAAYVF